MSESEPLRANSREVAGMFKAARRYGFKSSRYPGLQYPFSLEPPDWLCFSNGALALYLFCEPGTIVRRNGECPGDDLVKFLAEMQLGEYTPLDEFQSMALTCFECADYGFKIIKRLGKSALVKRCPSCIDEIQSLLFASQYLEFIKRFNPTAFRINKRTTDIEFKLRAGYVRLGGCEDFGGRVSLTAKELTLNLTRNIVTKNFRRETLEAVEEVARVCAAYRAAAVKEPGQ